MGSFVVGGLLALHGLRRRSRTGLALVLVGSGLMARGARGRPLGVSSLLVAMKQLARGRNGGPHRDIVQKTSEDSFPASDPPSWTAQR
jgi:hypothetical protein